MLTDSEFKWTFVLGEGLAKTNGEVFEILGKRGAIFGDDICVDIGFFIRVNEEDLRATHGQLTTHISMMEDGGPGLDQLDVILVSPQEALNLILIKTITHEEFCQATLVDVDDGYDVRFPPITIELAATGKKVSVTICATTDVPEVCIRMRNSD